MKSDHTPRTLPRERGAEPPPEVHLCREETDSAPLVDEERAGRAVQSAEDRALSSELGRARRDLARARIRIDELTRGHAELRNAIERLTEMASTDALTGLSNRRRFAESLDAAFALSLHQDSPLSLLMVDVDCFKSYNDTYGHSVGDLVLRIVARQFLLTARNYDVVARYGGEEFAILLPATGRRGALGCAERQRAAIASYQWPLRRVTASFGVATLGPGTRDPAALVEQADRALYHSKRHGRNRVTHFRVLDAAGTAPSAAVEPRPIDSRSPRSTQCG